MLFPTTLVGSYPRVADRPGEAGAGRFPPRVRAKELCRDPEPFLAQALDDATLLAIRAQEEAGLDIITDGEMRRESYSNRFATALEGVDIDNPGTALDRWGHPNPVPRSVGRIRRGSPGGCVPIGISPATIGQKRRARSPPACSTRCTGTEAANSWRGLQYLLR